MISFNKIGKYGRLGNQMFQYASLKGIASNNKYQHAIPYSSGLNEYSDHRLFSIFQMYNTNLLYTKNIEFSERYFHFDKDLFDNCPDNIDLVGYFQSYKYFENIKDEILEDFTFKNSYDFNYSDYVTLHVRRGDYLNQSQFHPTCDLSYYEKAMKHFQGEKFYIISDDVEWCRKQDIFNEHLVVEGTQEEDLYAMSKSKGNIIANSSFSWWGAYLNKNKNVICPKIWFGVQYNNYNLEDLRPKNWIQI